MEERGGGKNKNFFAPFFPFSSTVAAAGSDAEEDRKSPSKSVYIYVVKEQYLFCGEVAKKIYIRI